jgi:predicted TIM-barrel fold metal-dependent hydrolase
MRNRRLEGLGGIVHLGCENSRSGVHSPSRRQLLTALGAAGIGAILPSNWLLGQSASGDATPKAFRIDVHHHLLSPMYLKRTTRFDEAGARVDSPLTHWTPQTAIESMDKAGIATALMSIAVGGVRFEKDEATRIMCRENNDYGAKMVQDYPGRFGLLASLPLPDQDASLKEIAYAYDVLKADGIALVTDYDDKWPGDPIYEPAFEELNRRNAVVFVHPTAPTCCLKLMPNIAESWVEYDFDTSRAIISLLVNGTFEKFPNIRFIFSHSGGTSPAMAGRIDRMFPPKTAGARAPNGVMAEVSKLYFDIASGTYPAAMDAVLDVVPVSHLLFATDIPFVKAEETLDGLDKYKKLSKADLQAINRDNAFRLFPRLRA